MIKDLSVLFNKHLVIYEYYNNISYMTAKILISGPSVLSYQGDTDDALFLTILIIKGYH
jgi:hypothetical protein